MAVSPPARTVCPRAGHARPEPLHLSEDDSSDLPNMAPLSPMLVALQEERETQARGLQWIQPIGTSDPAPQALYKTSGCCLEVAGQVFQFSAHLRRPNSMHTIHPMWKLVVGHSPCCLPLPTPPGTPFMASALPSATTLSTLIPHFPQTPLPLMGCPAPSLCAHLGCTATAIAPNIPTCPG